MKNSFKNNYHKFKTTGLYNLLVGILGAAFFVSTIILIVYLTKEPPYTIEKQNYTDSCKKELFTALSKMRNDNGYRFNIPSNYIDTLANNGYIRIYYKSNGQEVGCGFALNKKDSESVLIHNFKSYWTADGITNSRNDFMTIKLSECICNQTEE